MNKEEKNNPEIIEQENQEVQDNNNNEVIQEDNNKIEEALKEEKDKFLRLFAEFDNFKKRSHKEKIDLIKYGNQEALSALLPVVDDFERAIKELEKNNNQETLTGIQLIQTKFLNILNEKGLSKIEVNIGDSFDIDKHEAITQIPAPSEDMKNKIIDVIETGYKLYEKIIRYTKVVVGS